MNGMGLYASMNDDEKEDERFSDEMGARNSINQDRAAADARTTSPSRRSSSNPDKKTKRKSKKRSTREDMTEEELIASARRNRKGAEKAESGLVAPRETDMRSTAPGASTVQPLPTLGARSIRGPGGVDEAVKVNDYDDCEEEDPFTQISSRSQPPQEGPNSSQKPRSSSKPKKEINKDFKDVRETGRWGSVSKKEMYVVGIIALLVVIGVIVAVVVVTTGGDDAPAPAANQAAPQQAPTIAPTARVVLTPQEQLDAIRGATIENPATQASLTSLPEDVSFYEGKANDPTAPPVVRAASWIMFDDPIDNEDWLLVRYGLAVLYYSTNGDNWTTKDGWLTEASACEWKGNRCDRFDKAVEEIDLSSNNLSGVIPDEINMVSSLLSLWLRGNNLSGTVPSVALGLIPQLIILYLDNNSLAGTIGSELAASGSLTTLFLQSNELTGILPIELCPVDGEGGLLEIGIDCDKMECFCCDPGLNCF